MCEIVKEGLFMKEVFMEIKDYPIYSVSNKGNVKNNYTEQMLKPFFDKDGYPMVKISNSQSRKTFRVHRLVALHFIENEYNKPQVNHIDGNKVNNNVENLEWVTQEENYLHALKAGLMRRRSVPVTAICISTGEKFYFESSSDCAKYLDSPKGSVSAVLNKKRNSLKGYLIEYTHLRI